MITNTTANLDTNEEAANNFDISSLPVDNPPPYTPHVLLPGSYPDAPPSYNCAVFGVSDSSVQIFPAIIQIPSVNEETSSETSSQCSIETIQRTGILFALRNSFSSCRPNFENDNIQCSGVGSYKIPFVFLCLKILIWVVLIKNSTRVDIIMSLILCNGLSTLMQASVVIFSFCSKKKYNSSMCGWIRVFVASAILYTLMFLIDFYYIRSIVFYSNTNKINHE